VKNLRKGKLRKLEKKRRKEKEQRRAAKAPTLAYSGGKYKRDEYIPLFHATETAIHETDVMSHGQLTDAIVWDALAEMIDRLRKGPLAALEDMSVEDQTAFSPQENVMYAILDHWGMYFERSPFPGRDILVGILRTTLGSIETWGSMSPTSRGYLDYLTGVLRKMRAGM
jgi:hypothetical protein